MNIVKEFIRILIVVYIGSASYFLTYNIIENGRETNDNLNEFQTEREADVSVKQNTPTPTIRQVRAADAKPATTDIQSKASVNTPPDNRCFIIIDSVRYDVTDFRKNHSGGDVFHCQTDMSDTFHNQHDDSYLQLMQKYRI